MTEPVRTDYEFLRQGQVTLSDALVDIGKKFFATVGNGSKWILIFDWALSRAVRMSTESAWKELPPGFDMGLIPRDEVSAEAICLSGSLEYVIWLPVSKISEVSGKVLDIGADKMIAVR